MLPSSTFLSTVHSQMRIALLNRTLWSQKHLTGGLRLGARWSVRPNGNAPTPLAMAWYLTHACPEQCDFCNVSRSLEVEYPTLNSADAFELIHRMVPKIPVVALGGGEPMAHPNVLPIIRRIHERRGRVFLVTSGTTVGRAKAKALCDEHPEMVMVSLLGDESTHDERMGRKGAFNRTLAVIENIGRYRNPKRTRLIVNCTVSPNEIGILDSVIQIARDVGIDALRFSWLSFMSPSENEILPKAEPYFILPQAEIDSFDWRSMWKKVLEIKRKHTDLVQFLPALNEREFKQWFGGRGVERSCLSLWHTLFVRPDGSVVPCGHMQEDSLGDLLSQPLEEIWNSSRFTQLRMAQRQKPFQMCGRCCKV